MRISLAMGFFDSVHIGHRELLRRNAQYATSVGAKAAVHTFDNDVSAYFNNVQLYDFSQRKQLLLQSGAQIVITDSFTEEFKNKSGKDFLDELTSRYDVAAFFCGYDYTFGKNASCNADDLASYAKERGMQAFVLPQQTEGGEKVSTTRIKELLLSGNVQKANQLLGAPYFIRGKVVRGRGEGGKYGFPTANVQHDGFLPKHGVYKTIVTIDGKRYVAVTNVGNKPTFKDQSVTIEPMIIDFCGDLYGKELTLEFVKYIRPTKKFSCGEELNEQIRKDVKEALC